MIKRQLSQQFKYFGALFNGHHDRNCEDSGRPFKPDYSGLPDFSEDLGSLSDDSQEKFIQKLSFDDLTNIVDSEYSFWHIQYNKCYRLYQCPQGGCLFSEPGHVQGI